MKITLNKITPPRQSIGDHTKLKETNFKGQDLKQCYDKITIHSASSDLPNNQFINMLKNHLSQEVKAGSSAFKLNDLSRQLALGEYDINATDIVKKIMLDSSEV